MKRRIGWALAVAGAAAAAAVAVGDSIHRVVRRSSRPHEDVFVERRSEPDREALEAVTNGDAAKIGLDLEKLRAMANVSHEPLIEYLSYIQVKRGDGQSIVFVRRRDLDAMASMTGTDKEDFVDDFQKMGVLLSMN